jgi:hypothetical protein
MKKTFKLLNNLDKNAIAIYHGRKIFIFGFSLAFPVVPEVNKIATICCAFISKFSIFLNSLTLGVMMHDGYPFYPLDIQQIALETPEPKILITTPLHLKACIINNIFIIN